ncbi:hypothetical protein MHU86_25211 [Fragilaria crotonensis]|nr:hypothetical protein MHU86_25211 [Fragilaria crotonensis]
MASTSITKEAAPVTLEKPVLGEEDPNKTNRFGALGAARLSGIGNALTSSMAKIGMDKPVADIQSSAEGRFAGLGAAFNKQLKNATNSGFRNRFRMFLSEILLPDLARRTKASNPPHTSLWNESNAEPSLQPSEPDLRDRRNL